MQTMDCISPRAISIYLWDDVAADESAEIIPSAKNPKGIVETIRIGLEECFHWIKRYFKKFRGLHENRPNRLSWDEHFWIFIGSLISVILIATIHYRLFEK